ncbi:Hypothetical protein (Fragment) [Durusdinium trenchii]|uniref:Fe2OG dioxygenase domain-containing protein n=1 Tax=Durusdinium trenchii TaxID=1381693 RepID=A0ABP0SAI5_9DINO
MKAQRQWAFARAAAERWPSLGELRSLQGRDECLDVECPFWKAGQARYASVLQCYFSALERCEDTAKRDALLLDLGFHMVEDFLSEEEEAALLRYWSPEGPIFPLGTEETYSRRRFFHYGPILPKETKGTSKSTLNVIPSVFGAMPPLVETLRLRPRLRAAAQSTGLTVEEASLGFDQMYVNYYDTSINSYIDFHHDHQSCMLGTVAGISLGSACQLQLKPLRQRKGLSIELPRRSLFFMSGLSRWHLQHAIPELFADRLSLTFRTVDRSCGRAEQWKRTWEQLTAAEARRVRRRRGLRAASSSVRSLRS